MTSRLLSLLAVVLILLTESQLDALAFGQIKPIRTSLHNNKDISQAQDKSSGLHGQSDSGSQWMDTVRSRGFNGEAHTTRARDNNPISVYHIINPLARRDTLERQPVLMFHGILMDAAQTIGHSEKARPRAPVVGNLTADPSDTSLAFMLANNNFDVWMCEARGTNLNNHLASYDPQAQKFWNFSLDKQVHYDLTVMVDFVLTQTGADKLHYVGYSESTFMMFALLSSLPDYQEKLASFTALAPVAYVGHLKGIRLVLFASTILVPEGFNANFLSHLGSDALLGALRGPCQLNAIARNVCQGLISSIGGLSDNSLHAKFFSNFGRSTSMKAVRQFMQLYAQRRFGMYDYGHRGNLRQYGQPVPPAYLLANIRLPSILLIRGGNDFLSTPGDQKRLLAELGARPYLDLYYPGYNHFDFLIGNQIVNEVNLPTARVMLDWSREWARRQKTKFPANATAKVQPGEATLALQPSISSDNGKQ